MSKYAIVTSNSGTVYADSIEYNDEWMGESSVTATIKSPTPIDWSIGDYIMYRGDKYTIAVPPSETKQARKESNGEAFVYENIKFVGCENELTNCEFRDVVLADDSKHFTALLDWNDYFEDVTEFADRLKANLDRLYTTDKWTVRVLCGDDYYISGTSTKPTSGIEGKKSITISFSNETVWDAMSHIKDDFDLNFIIRGRVITIGAVGSALTEYLKYGKGNGLTKIEKTTDDSQGIITRLRAYGNETNMPITFYQKVGISTFAYYTQQSGYNGWYDGLRDEFALRLSGFGICSLQYAYDLYDNSDYIKNCTNYIFIKELSRSCFRGFNSNNETLTTATCSGAEVSSLPVVAINSTKSGILILLNDNVEVQKGFWYNVIGGNQIFFTEATNKTYWPTEWLTAKQSDIPDNMNVKNLMLPGFAVSTDMALDDFVDDIYVGSIYDYSQALAILTELGYDTAEKLRADFEFSSDPLDPWIQSKNADTIGIKEGSVTFDGSVDDYDDIYPSLQFVGTSNKIVRADTITDNGVFDTEKTIPNFTIDVELDFNPRNYISYGSTSFTVHMQDGYCGGRDFTCVGVKFVSGKKYTLTLQRSQDSSLDLYFPYSCGTGNPYQILAGDTFVLTDIDMPEEYVLQTATNALLPNAIKYLKNNCYAVYNYSLSLDKVHIQRYCDTQAASGTTTFHDSIKAGDVVKFADVDLGIDGQITIDKLTIKEGSGLPDYEITLSEDKIVGNISRMQTQISSLAKSVVNIGTSTENVKDLIKEVGDKRYMRSDADTRTTGNVEIEKNLTVDKTLDVEGDASIGGGASIGGNITAGGNITSTDYNKGLSGFNIGADTAEMGGLTLRNFLEVPELRYNRVTVRTGVQWQTFGGGIIEEVTIDKDEDGEELPTGIIKLKLEDGEVGAVAVNDKCMGIFHNETDTSKNATEDSDEKNGNFSFKGFMTIYFIVTAICDKDGNEITDGSGNNQYFKYQLRSAVDSTWSYAYHPMASMSFAAYANYYNSSRQASIYSTTSYLIMLTGMTGWTYGSSNIALIYGDMDGFTIKSKGGTSVALSGYGIAFGNAYMWGTIQQFDRDAILVSQQAYYTSTINAPSVVLKDASYKTHYTWVTTPASPTSTAPYVYIYWHQTFDDGSTKDVGLALLSSYNKAPRILYRRSKTTPSVPTTSTPVGWSEIPHSVDINLNYDLPNKGQASCLTNYGFSQIETTSGTKFKSLCYNKDSACSWMSVTIRGKKGDVIQIPYTISSELDYDYGFICTADELDPDGDYPSDPEVEASGDYSGVLEYTLAADTDVLYFGYLKDGSYLDGSDTFTIDDSYTGKLFSITEILNADGTFSGWSGVVQVEGEDGSDPVSLTASVQGIMWPMDANTYIPSSTPDAEFYVTMNIGDRSVSSFTSITATLDHEFGAWQPVVDIATGKITVSPNYDDKMTGYQNNNIHITAVAEGYTRNITIPIIIVTSGTSTQGPQGIQGCVIRLCGEYDPSVAYYNDSALTAVRSGESVRYIDIVQFTDSGSVNYYQRNTSSQGSSGLAPTDTNYWSKANKFSFIATDVLMADNAWIQYLTGKSVYVTDNAAKTNIVAGMQSVTDSTTPMIFAGASKNDAANAEFKVLADGSVYATSLHASGELEGSITDDDNNTASAKLMTYNGGAGLWLSNTYHIDETEYTSDFIIKTSPKRGGDIQLTGQSFDNSGAIYGDCEMYLYSNSFASKYSKSLASGTQATSSMGLGGLYEGIFVCNIAPTSSLAALSYNNYNLKTFFNNSTSTSKKSVEVTPEGVTLTDGNGSMQLTANGYEPDQTCDDPRNTGYIQIHNSSDDDYVYLKFKGGIFMGIDYDKPSADQLLN